jgi:hypothetical protein
MSSISALTIRSSSCFRGRETCFESLATSRRTLKPLCNAFMMFSVNLQPKKTASGIERALLPPFGTYPQYEGNVQRGPQRSEQAGLRSRSSVSTRTRVFRFTCTTHRPMPDSREYMRKVLRRGLLDVNYHRGHVRLRMYLGRMVVFGYRHSRDGLCDNQEFSEMVHNPQNAGEWVKPSATSAA